MRTLLSTLMGIGAILFGASAGAQAEREIQVDIQSQVLVDALNQWAQTTGYRLIGPADATRHLMSPRVQGSFTPRAALARLLSGTVLTYEFLDEHTVAIQEPPTASPPSIGSSSPKQLRLSEVKFVNETTGSGDAESPAVGRVESDNGKRQRGTLEEVVVTAQKREERLQDVPIAISVLAGKELDTSTAEGITEALNQVPGVSTTVFFQGGWTQVAVRGVTASGVGYFGASPVAYYLDSAPFGLVKSAFAPDANAYDLDRVEVLRGPQGTLYGANAQNGVVRVLTRDPNPDEFEFKARTSASGTQGGGENYRADMAINVPIVPGKFAARAVAGYQDLSGWIDRPNKRDANGAEIGNFRLKLNAQPTDQLSLGLSAWRSRADYGAPSTGDASSQNSATLDESISNDYDVYGLKIGYRFSSWSVASATSYIDFTSDSALDYNAVVGLPPETIQNPVRTGHPSKVSSQEIVASSTGDGSWRWTVGGMYRDADERLVQTADFLPAAIDFTDTSESIAAFGEVTRVFFGGGLELTAGLRYFEDEVEVRENVRHTGVPTEPKVHATSNFHKVTPRVVLTWLPSEQLTIYGSYAEGFRSGFNQQPTVINSAPDIPPAKPDLLKNYELGAKGSLWGGRVGFDAAVYFIDWQGVQQSLVVPFSGTLVTALLNGKSASGMGFDLGLTAQLIEGLDLGVNFSWNDLTMDDDVISGGSVLFDKGDRLNFSAERTIGGSVDYAFPFGRDGFEARFSISANYTSEQGHRTLLATGLYETVGDPILTGRTSFSVAAPEHWTATLFVDNFSNERGTPIKQPWAGRPFPDWDARIRPRTVGAQLEYSF